MFRSIRQFVVLTLVFLFTALPAARVEAGPLECSMLPQLFQNYFKYHVSVKTFSETLKENTIEQFMKNMDPSKTLFIESDVTKLRAELGGIFNSMRGGNCKVLDQTNQLMKTRAKQNEDFVRTFVSKNYVVDKTAEFMIDPDKRGFAKTEADKQDILKKLVHFQMSNFLLAKVKQDEAQKLLIHRYELITKRVNERDSDSGLVSIAEAFALALDPHSGYLPKDRLEDFQIQMQLSLEGIGATLTSDNGFTIVEGTIPGGSAERAKVLRPKDKILAVAQDGEKPIQIIDMDLREVVKMIRGKKGTKVTLTILRQGESTETFDVTLVRDKIDIKTQAASISYVDKTVGKQKLKIGVIELPSFYGGGNGDGARSSFTDMKNLLLEAKKEKVDGIVLDLSRNGGGLLDTAVKISGLFLRKGGIVATKDYGGNIDVLSDDDDDTIYAGPLLILVSRLSASASEILSGTLRDYGRALVVGSDHTFGKGSVQAVVDLPRNLGAMTVTTGMFFVAGGASTQHRGVSSDIRLPSFINEDELGESMLDYSLPPQTIKPFISSDANSAEKDEHWKTIDQAAIKTLTEKSRLRVEKEPKFAELKKNIEENRKNQGSIRLADIWKKSNEKANEKSKGKSKGKDKIKNDDDEKQPREEELKELQAPLINEAVNIMADLAAK